MGCWGFLEGARGLAALGRGPRASSLLYRNFTQSSAQSVVRPTSLQALTPESYREAQRDALDYVKGGGLAEQVLLQLKQQNNPSTCFGMAINLYEHGLQTATRALRNGEDEEMVVMALLHDVCEHTVPSGHGPAASMILGPYLSEERKWILENHEVFQGFYYYHLAGRDPATRDRHRENPFFDACARFCELYDAPSFDPKYKTEALETFTPMVERFFSRMPRAQGDCVMMDTAE
mmetsp:Transcript_20760/g.48198  ORF Transcript_20760/g.48198 Transcript_20760/m.48198 type:complete len:234 (+) Transcript_20760:100-801(+)